MNDIGSRQAQKPESRGILVLTQIYLHIILQFSVQLIADTNMRRTFFVENLVANRSTFAGSCACLKMEAS